MGGKLFTWKVIVLVILKKQMISMMIGVIKVINMVGGMVRRDHDGGVMDGEENDIEGINSEKVMFR